MNKIKFNALIPELSVSDFEKSLHFYVDMIGFKIEYTRNENNFAFLSLNDIQIMIEKTNENWKTGELEHPYGRGINFQFEVENITEILKRLEMENYPIFVEPEENWYRVNDVLYGLKEFLILDPDGYLLRFSEELGTKEIHEDKPV
jgi:catechol 2,3-dioxygenase-like lactoylglutathione lyase family enzyme